MTFSRRKFGSLALSLSGIALLAGCGSGGGDGMATTRKRVQTIDRALGSRSAFDPILMITGASGGAMADSLGTFLGSNDMPPIGLGGTAYSRAKATTRATTNSAFYYDGYLKLWAQRTKNDTETTSEVRYDFFVDEAKTQSGGFMTSLQPKWNYYYDKPTPEAAGASDLTVAPPIFWNPTYPQTYKTEYKFTAGTMAGSHGLSETTTEADYSTTSKYENVYADGWKDSGNSRSDMSSSTWSSRIDTTRRQVRRGRRNLPRRNRRQPHVVVRRLQRRLPVLLQWLRPRQDLRPRSRPARDVVVGRQRQRRDPLRRRLDRDALSLRKSDPAPRTGRGRR